MKLNANYILKTLSGKTRKRKSYSKNNNYYLNNQIQDLHEELWKVQKDIHAVLKKLDLRKVGDIIMNEKDAKKYDDQW